MTNDAGALNAIAKPFTDLLNSEDGITELVINGIGQAFLEISGHWHPHPHIAVRDSVETLNAALANYAKANLSKTHPLLSASLPTGERVQSLIAPVVKTFALSIRKPSTLNLTLDDYNKQGAFDIHTRGSAPFDAQAHFTGLLDEAQNTGSLHKFFVNLISQRQTLIISGGTSSGKTTFFNAACKLIDPKERLISIEDTPELVLTQPNTLSLVAQRNSERANFITLLEACLRLRPDRILAAEIRSGSEALAFLEGANTGHPGSMTTLHANNTQQARERLTLMLMRENIGLTRDQILLYLTTTVDCFVHMARIDNKRVITEINYRGRVVNFQ